MIPQVYFIGVSYTLLIFGYFSAFRYDYDNLNVATNFEEGREEGKYI